MTTDTAPNTETPTPAGSDAGGDRQHAATEHGWPDAKYIQLGLFLAVITALEVYASYADWLGPAFVPALLIMMAVKFAAVVLFFMHLKFDSALFSFMFYAGMGMALIVYIGMLLTFQFFVG